MATRAPLEQRFWSKVDKRGPDDCWPWTAQRRRTGYGLIFVEGRGESAARVAWTLANGQPWPEGKIACHTCDNPPCVNPAHIWVGTPADNAADRTRKGRGRGKALSVNRTHCASGHPFNEQNAYLWRGYLKCRACNLASHRRRSAEKRETLRNSLPNEERSA